MRKLVVLLALITSGLRAQELVQSAHERGYVKDGVKYSLWQYFNEKKEVELSINHSTGRVMYVKPDTTAFPIYKNETWELAKLTSPPMPIAGYHNFYQRITDNIKYRLKDFENGLEGVVTLTFEVDTLGSLNNLAVVNTLSPYCDSLSLAGLKAAHLGWAPARIDKKKYPVKFALNVLFRLKRQEVRDGIGLPAPISNVRTLDPIVADIPLEKKTFTFVEKSAEPEGGLPAFYKWISKVLKYPVSARRRGLEGKVFVKFIIEPTGEITHPETVKGLSEDCDKEALRIMSIAPRWQPGTQSGRAVRQMYTLPIYFKLAK